MKSFRIITVVCICLLLGSVSLKAQTKTSKYSEPFSVEIPCINESINGTLYIHEISHLAVKDGYNRWLRNFHSSELVGVSGNEYRIAGGSEEIISSSEMGSVYYAVWHYVGKKGIQFKIVVTYGDINEFGESGINILSVEASCE